jgi:NAD(P)-dependent dehydrogenase (short-subunit alcohol dehydrogenase family)
VRITQTHPFYDRLCDSCGEKNYSMRSFTCDLKGKRAIVTGGRIKIGFEIALKLLRAGAEVVVTTRFPRDARIRFQAEADAADWLQRLHFYQLDLLSLAQVTAFTSHVQQRWSSVDIFICNAAQTIRRPADFFELPLRLEYSQQQTAESVRQALPSIANAAALGSIVPSRLGGDTIQQRRPTSIGATNPAASVDSALTLAAPSAKRAKHGGACSVAVSAADQIMAQRLARQPHDEHGQPLDLRPRNTWDARLEEVPLMEAAECVVINYLSPFALLQGLHPLMRRSPVSRQPSAAADPSTSPPPPITPACTVLVSAMEGKFSCFKRVAHPHTNAAKAALNMLVRTSAPDFAANAGILLTAVDTGWVTEEFASTDATRGVLHPPIDEIDAASRVLHPVFAAHHPTHPQQYKGVLLKDYSPTSW